MSQWDEDDVTKEEWKRQLHESRQLARSALSECARPAIDEWTAVNVPELVQYLHAQTLDYYRHVAPKRAGVQDLTDDQLTGVSWDEPLCMVEVPTSQTVDAGMTDWYGDYDVGDILSEADWVKKPVTLATLRKEWQRNNRITISANVRHRVTGEEITEQETVSLHLPPAACEMVIAGLDDVLEDLKWLPEAAELTNKGEDLDVVQP